VQHEALEAERCSSRCRRRRSRARSRPADLARINELVYQAGQVPVRGGADRQAEAQKRQATQAPQGAPETQPGWARLVRARSSPPRRSRVRTSRARTWRTCWPCCGARSTKRRASEGRQRDPPDGERDLQDVRLALRPRARPRGHGRLLGDAGAVERARHPCTPMSFSPTWRPSMPRGRPSKRGGAHAPAHGPLQAGEAARADRHRPGVRGRRRRRPTRSAPSPWRTPPLGAPPSDPRRPRDRAGPPTSPTWGMPPGAPLPGSLPPLSAPTDRPDEHLMSGVPAGPGPGPEALLPTGSSPTMDGPRGAGPVGGAGTAAGEGDPRPRSAPRWRIKERPDDACDRSSRQLAGPADAAATRRARGALQLRGADGARRAGSTA
jgi:hypothetical protein